MARALSLWLPPLAWMAVIFALSSRPLPPDLQDVPDWISHPVAYAALGGLLLRALSGGRAPLPRHALWAVVLSTLYGISDELHQSFVPGRSADAWDVLKDFLGATALALVALRRVARSLSPEGRR